MKRVLLVIVLSVAACGASSRSAHVRPYRHYPRSRAVTKEFQRLHPCPSTGKRSGACPGWVKDHIKPLCKGGEDSVDNLQWQTTAAAAAKDKTEWLPASASH